MLLFFALTCFILLNIGATGLVSTITPPSGAPSCGLLSAPCSRVIANALAGRGAGCRLTCSNDSQELASSLDLRLPACWTDGRWEAVGQRLACCCGSRQTPLS
jgi:hypothetical protein